MVAFPRQFIIYSAILFLQFIIYSTIYFFITLEYYVEIQALSQVKSVHRLLSKHNVKNNVVEETKYFAVDVILLSYFISKDLPWLNEIVILFCV